MRPFLPFATLVSAAFLLGCQESAPVGPDTEITEPNFVHKFFHNPGSGGQGGGDGNATTPAKITFDDGAGDRIKSDGTVLYSNGASTGLEVFIGSRANTGNIFLKSGDTRKLSLDFSVCPGTCSAPPFVGALAVPANLRVNAKDRSSGIKGGVFALGTDGTLSVPMRVLFITSSGDFFFLRFDPDRRGCEGSSLVKVTRVVATDVWVVEPNDPNALGCLVPAFAGPHAVSLGLFKMLFKFTVQVL